MKIQRLALENFQGIRKAEFHLYGKNAAIYGDNATGKTTVANAITWLLYDKAADGAKNYSPQTRDADGDVHRLVHAVEMTIQADGGRVITLRKEYHEVWKKKRGSAQDERTGNTIDYFIDGVPAQQKAFEAARAGILGDTLQVRALTQPDYFAAGMTWQERRQTLIDICGDVDDLQIIRADPELQPLEDLLTIPGTDRKYTIDEYKQILAAERKTINARLDEIPHRIDEATKAMPETTGNRNTLQLQRDAYRREVDDAMQQINAIDAGQENPALEAAETAVREAKHNIETARAEYAEKRAKTYEAEAAEYLDAKEKHDAGEAEYNRLLKQADDAEAAAERMSAARQQALADYNEMLARTFPEDATTCPTCGQPLPADQIEEKRAAFNQAKSDELSRIGAIGRANSLDKINSAINTAEAIKMTAETKRWQIVRLPARPQMLPAFEDTEEYKTLLAAFDEAVNRRDAARADTIKQNDLKARTQQQVRAQEARDAIFKINEQLAKIDMAEQQQARIKDLQTEHKALGSEYARVEQAIYLTEQFIRAKVTAIDAKINGRFESVRFRLFREQINGGVTEDCEVLIPAPDGAMVPWPYANNAARINAGLEIIDTLSSAWGLSMPVIIDNAEAVTRLRYTAAQKIMLIVSAEDKTLRLETED